MNVEVIYSKLEEIQRLLNEHALFQKEILNLSEAAQYLGISKSHLYKLTSSGQLPHYKPGGKLVFFNRKELEQWVLKHKIHSVDELETKAEDYMVKKRF